MQKTEQSLTLFIVAALFTAGQPPARAAAADPQHEILICTSDHSSAAIQKAADDMAKRPGDVPVLKGLIETQGAGPAVRISSEELLKKYNLAAFNHLVVIGLKSEDPLVQKVWEHYAAVDEVKKVLYAQGWGWLKGDLGYIRSDRNPFLHSRRIKSAPFETVIFKLSGTSEIGVLAAIRAFAAPGILNGIVPAGAFERPEKTLLDLDPITTEPDLKLAPLVDVNGAASPLVGWTQAPGNEYRAYIDAAGFEPVGVWRYKYLVPHALDEAKTPGWMAGFHRMAYGNSVNVVEFKSSDEAEKTAEAISRGGGWRASAPISGTRAWISDQPIDENMAHPLGTVIVTWHDRFLILSTLPMAATAVAIAAGR